MQQFDEDSCLFHQICRSSLCNLEGLSKEAGMISLPFPTR